MGEKVKAMSRAERDLFLRTAAESFPQFYTAHLLMSFGGLRLGECLGLRFESL